MNLYENEMRFQHLAQTSFLTSKGLFLIFSQTLLRVLR
jgi:hypothetical protein